MIGWFASIPSPGSNAIHIGPLQLRAYGVMIALGVVAAVWLSGRRAEATGRASREDIGAIALWAVPAGVIGARIYHVITDWKSFRGRWLEVFEIWSGGLGVWGGIALGTFVGTIVARKRGLHVGMMLDVAAPGLALAQAIGRWGNWWNQEVFGRPLDTFFALEIDPRHRPEGFERFDTFHPTFLYESLWNFGLCAALLLIDRRYRLRPTKLFALYVAGYTLARFFIERIRIDAASQLWGLRVNEWVSAVVFLTAVAYLVFTKPRPLPPVGVPAEVAPEAEVASEHEH